MPFEDQKAWATVLGFIGDYRPDHVIQLGHMMNLPPSGRFSGQVAIGLHRRELTKIADYISRNYLSRLRQVYDGPLRIIYSAASARLAAALQAKASLETGAVTMCIERLVQLNGCDNVELSAMHILAPGWTVLYGDNIAVADSEVPGNSALKIAKHLGVSVIVGHTMRLGKGTYTVMNADDVSYAVTGVEVGNLVDQRRTVKMDGRAQGWRQGFAILETDGSSVSAECIPLSANRTAVRWGRSSAGW